MVGVGMAKAAVGLSLLVRMIVVMVVVPLSASVIPGAVNSGGRIGDRSQRSGRVANGGERPLHGGGVEHIRVVVALDPDALLGGDEVQPKVELISHPRVGRGFLLQPFETQGVRRRVEDFTVTPYDLPSGCIAAYYPEANPLVPLSWHDKASKTPAYKGVPVRIET